MAQNLELTGVVRNGRVIELDAPIPLPDGAHVRIRLVPETGHDGGSEEEAEAAKTLQTIYEMRRQGRSIQKP